MSRTKLSPSREILLAFASGISLSMFGEIFSNLDRSSSSPARLIAMFAFLLSALAMFMAAMLGPIAAEYSARMNLGTEDDSQFRRLRVRAWGVVGVLAALAGVVAQTVHILFHTSVRP
jgi:hypothetical protein